MSLGRPAAEAVNSHEKLVALLQSVMRPRTVPREAQARLNPTNSRRQGIA